MRCIKCGAKTKVMDTRNSESKTTFGGQNRVEANVSWYTRDWVYRRRHCPSCSESTITIEIPLDDLEKGWQPKNYDSETL